MAQILASSKTGLNKFENNSADKVLSELPLRQIAQSYQTLYQITQGYSLSGDQGSTDAIAANLSVITTTNIATYEKDLSQAIQTLVSNAGYLDVDGASTANAITLNAPIIAPDNAPDTNNYSEAAPLPFKYEENLRFNFRATLSNTGAMTISIPGLAGLVGATELLDENENSLSGGEILANKYYTVITKTISTVKKLILIESRTNTPAFRSYLAADQSVSSGVYTTINVDTVDFESDSGSFDTALKRFNPQKAGIYQFNATWHHLTISADKEARLDLRKNGTSAFGRQHMTGPPTTSRQTQLSCSGLIQLNGTTDYVDIAVLHNQAGAVNTIGGIYNTYFSGFLLIGTEAV